MNRFLTAMTWALAAIWPTADTHSADVQAKDPVVVGRKIAVRVCADCHVVTPDQKSARLLFQRTPSFPEIANRPATSARSLEQFLYTTRWDQYGRPMTMPNLNLPKEQAGYVVAYIMSLRGSPAPAAAIAVPGTPTARQRCLDSCVARSHTQCMLGYCAKADSIFHGIEPVSEAIKRCQARC
ncbi:MAG: cytochrome c [Caulobacteraceae bacterium]|nr:cytochrome c [Caulobacteraceae bacterium]